MMTKLEDRSVVLAPHIRFDLGKLRGGINVGDDYFNVCPNMLWRVQDDGARRARSGRTTTRTSPTPLSADKSSEENHIAAASP